MKYTGRYLLLPALAVAALLACVPSSQADDAADHEALRQLKSVYEAALNHGDLSPLRAFPAANFSGVLLLGEEIHSYDELEANWKKLQGMIGHGGEYRVKINPQLSDLYGDTAVSRGTNDEYVRTDKGREFRFLSSWTVVSHRENSQWKVVRMQASMDPISNVFVEAKLGAARWIYGSVGAIIGLIVGVLGARLVKARPRASTMSSTR